MNVGKIVFLTNSLCKCCSNFI